MAGAEWFVVDRRTNRIVNAVMTSLADGPDLSKWLDGPHLYAVREPTLEQLESYRGYWERP